ncbi:hypothetical protein WNY59_01985 [Ahrensia kielensis]|uniref:Uncharacterized protein n=1 Tax=Ahrensia kielensis TaxID=76980 RepID=A0ABU9T2K6_9HYPH
MAKIYSSEKGRALPIFSGTLLTATIDPRIIPIGAARSYVDGVAEEFV